MLQFLLAFLIACGSAALRAQSDAELLAAARKEEHAHLQSLIESRDPKDRLRAVNGLDSLFMDYDQLWKLMNDTDIEVRTAAIETLRLYFCTHQGARPLPAGLAREMTLMLEKEVTQKRMDEAFQPGAVKMRPAFLVVSSAMTLNHLYLFHSFSGCAYDYTLWQGNVLRPLVTLLVHRSGEIEGALSTAQNDLLGVISDPSTLMKTLQVVMEGLDSKDLPPSRLQNTLESLWCHPLLGKGAPLELMLVAQLSPRLEQLAQRILGPMQKGGSKEYAGQLLNEITEAVLTARLKLPPSTHEP